MLGLIYTLPATFTIGRTLKIDNSFDSVALGQRLSTYLVLVNYFFVLRRISDV